MKSLHQKLSGIAPMIFFPMLMIFRKRKSSLFVCVFFGVICLSSCYLHFFRPNTMPSIDAATAGRLKSENKYFIIHFQNSTNGLEEAFISGDSLHGKLVPLPQEHLGHLHPDSPKRNRVKKADKKATLMEVHLYTNEKIQVGDSTLSTSLSSFDKVDVYELNKSATNLNHVLSTIGFAYAGLTIAGLIAFAIACNCPQVSVYNNGQYEFKSGLYSGAVYSTLERMDYLPLNGIPANAKEISFKIANAKSEEQFINKVELLQVNHEAGIHVLADRHGRFFAYSRLQLPLTAAAGKANDVSSALQKADEVFYSFDNSSDKNSLSDVVLTFDKPQTGVKAKLVVQARNTFWGGLLHKEFIGLFGDGYEKWRAKQERADPKKLEQWQKEQALPMMVYLKTSKGWEFVDYFQLVGNTAIRNMVMEINTEGINSNTIELKLETAYRFWDLDFAGIDYSANNNFTTTAIQPEQAITLDNSDQKKALISNDDQYAHLTGDNAVSFKYIVPAIEANHVSSYFIVSGGYYHNLEPVTGKMNYIELLKFKKKGAFDKFSREKYQQARGVAAIMKSIQR